MQPNQTETTEPAGAKFIRACAHLTDNLQILADNIQNFRGNLVGMSASDGASDDIKLLQLLGDLDEQLTRCSVATLRTRRVVSNKAVAVLVRMRAKDCGEVEQ